MAKTKILAKVVSLKDKTATVLNTFDSRHPRYQKIIKKTKKYLTENDISELAVEDIVEIEECRPISKRKKFRVIRIIKKKND